MTTIEWNYKDSNRRYWKLTAEPLAIFVGDDRQWIVTVSRSEEKNQWVLIFADHLLGDCGNPLQMADVLLAWSQHNSALLIGMAQYATQTP